MNGRSATLQEVRVALKRGYTVVATQFPCDIDTAGVKLEQAAGILDMLSEVQGQLPGTRPGTFQSIMMTLLDQITDAQLALFGKPEGRP